MSQDQNQEPNQEQNEQDKEKNPEQTEEQRQQQEPNEVQNQKEKDAVKEEQKDKNTPQKDEEKDKKKKDKGKGSWGLFIYNHRTGELLGRTAASWGLIILFYLIFYGFLAGMFSLTMWVMLQTLDNDFPRYQDRVANPGLVIRPHAVEISYNLTNPTSYNQYAQQLHDLLQLYNDSIQEANELCLVGEYTQQDDEAPKKVCQFKRSILRQCSGLPDTSFGYAEGKPCIIIKMNRVIGLKPNGDPYINCSVKGDSPLQMQYFPPEGRLDKMFFPYYGRKAHPKYVQPLVAVKFLLTKDDYNMEQIVECKVQGSDLCNNDDRDKNLGRVTFRVKVSQ
ncbi:sodium/potassium-transporting ATPase subunit beta-3-like [Xenentodon cancila]